MLLGIVYVSMILGTWTAVIGWILYLRLRNNEKPPNPRYYPLSQSIAQPKQKDAMFNTVDKLTSWIAFYKQTQDPQEGYLFTSTAAFYPTYFTYKGRKYGFVKLDDVILYREWYFQNIMALNTTIETASANLNYRNTPYHCGSLYPFYIQ